jgi:hypothetical protein
VVQGIPAGSTTAVAAPSAEALAALNGQAAALRTALTRQATAGNTLVVADGVWTKGIKINPEYASSMKTLFKVRTARPVGWDDSVLLQYTWCQAGSDINAAVRPES